MWCLVLHKYSRTTKVLAGSILRAENPDDMRLYSWKKKWNELKFLILKNDIAFHLL